MIPALMLLATYCVALIAAGHGIGPVGLLLIMGRSLAWVPGQVLGWGSIIALGVVTVRYSADFRKRAIGQLLASVGLYLSWAAFTTAALWDQTYNFWRNLGAFFILSAPFQIAFISVTGYLLWKLDEVSESAL